MQSPSPPLSPWFSIMRVPSLAICTLAVLAASDLSSLASASTTSSSPTQTPNAEEVVVVPVTSDVPSSTAATQKIADAQVVVPVNSGTRQPSAPAQQPVNSQVVVPVNSATTRPARAIAAPETRTLPQFTQTTRVPQKAPASSINSPDLVVTATGIEVAGATPELQQIVRQTIKTRPGGDTSQSQLQKDVTAILATGLFTDANVNSYTEPNGLRTVFEVKPLVVRSLKLSGAQALTPAVANDIFKSQLGAKISPNALNQSAEQINQWYKQNGYVAAQVLAVQPSRDGVVTIEVAEGIVGNVKIRFLDSEGKPTKGRTQENFVRQELKLKPGQPFRVDAARTDLQRLYQLGLFDNADVSLTGDSRKVDVSYDLTERTSRAVNVGGGYSENSGIFGSINYKDQNFGGINQQVGLNVQASRSDLQFNGNITSPYRASNPDRPGYSIEASRQRQLSETFNEDVKLPNGDKVREGQFGGGVTFTKPVGDVQASVGVNYTRTSIRDSKGNLSPVDELGNRLSYSQNGIDDKVSVSAGIAQDKRDNPINPTKGSVVSLSTEQSIPVGNGSILMNRVKANYSQYIPFNLTNGATPDVLAFNVQGGTTIGNLPPYEAFNLGGINSVRGYGSGDVASGRSYVLASAEYRFPVFKPVGGVLFADFGSDLGSGDTVPGEPGTVRGKQGTGFGYGAGVRVQSPIGLLRADFGINDHGESRLQFGIGQRF
ncbi:BamA/TamA family outer membrane protein [Trichocoleus sp. DQ-U1]|uniref:BamA/TamA family outer membrane protein n=1 Tax=Trichocoleus sp. DQ-U1 TaxID=2933926 RepID=UPI003299BDA2